MGDAVEELQKIIAAQLGNLVILVTLLSGVFAVYKNWQQEKRDAVAEVVKAQESKRDDLEEDYKRVREERDSLLVRVKDLEKELCGYADYPLLQRRVVELEKENERLSAYINRRWNETVGGAV